MISFQVFNMMTIMMTITMGAGPSFYSNGITKVWQNQASVGSKTKQIQQKNKEKKKLFF